MEKRFPWILPPSKGHWQVKRRDAKFRVQVGLDVSNGTGTR